MALASRRIWPAIRPQWGGCPGTRPRPTAAGSASGCARREFYPRVRPCGCPPRRNRSGRRGSRKTSASPGTTSGRRGAAIPRNRASTAPALWGRFRPGRRIGGGRAGRSIFQRRLIRGGSWNNEWQYVRSANRRFLQPIVFFRFDIRDFL
jgi:hypothetical protein